MFRTYKKFWKAAANGDLKTLVDYLNNAAKLDIDAKGDDGRTALHLAAYNDQTEAINILLRFGAKTEAKNSAGSTPLMLAICTGKTKAAVALVKGGSDVNAAEDANVRPLHMAAFHGELDVVKALVDAGADIDAAITTNGLTALHWAIDKENAFVVEYLASKGARLDMPDKKGRTALDLAQLKGPHVVRLINKARGIEVLPPAGEAQATSPWKRTGDNLLAHINEMPELGRRITEIFNFESRERTVISENLATGAETLTSPESFDAIGIDALRKAVEAFRAAGGEADENHVLGPRGGAKPFRL